MSGENWALKLQVTAGKIKKSPSHPARQLKKHKEWIAGLSEKSESNKVLSKNKEETLVNSKLLLERKWEQEPKIGKLKELS